MSTSKRTIATIGALTAFGATALLSAQPAAADGVRAGRSYTQTNLVSNIQGLATHLDANLQNPWGISFGPGSPLWISDNNAGAATLYDGAGNAAPSAKNPLVVQIPAPPSAGAGAVGAPTGTVFNTFDGKSPDFVVSNGAKSGPAFFLFASEDGTIIGWNPSVDRQHAEIAVDRSTISDPAGDVGAVYKGLAELPTPAGKFLYATDFRFGTIEVFDSQFNLVKSFTDPAVPTGFAPFGIHAIGGRLFVTFAKQNAQKHDDVAGPGNGFVDVFTANGALLQRFASEGRLNSPWAVTLAPATFGAFANDILIGNFGDGHINAFDPRSGHFEGRVLNGAGTPIVIQDLWDLNFPSGALNAVPGALYFTAGINDEHDGLFGDIVPKS